LLIKLLSHSSTVPPALRVLGNIFSGDDSQVEIFKSKGLSVIAIY